MCSFSLNIEKQWSSKDNSILDSTFEKLWISLIIVWLFDSSPDIITFCKYIVTM